METLGRLIPDIKMKWQYILPVVMIAVGVVLSVTGFLVLQQREYREIELSFSQDAAERYDSLKKEIDFDIQTLEAITAFYQASREVERSEFQSFVKPLLDRHQSIQALEWIPRVTAGQRDTYEKAARRQGHPGFEFTERDAQGRMTRSSDREEYFPVYFVEPYKGNETALGFNLASNRTREASLSLARDTGKTTATSRITLVQETANQPGFLVFAPVYRKHAPLASSDDRRKNLTGFVLGVFRISNIVEHSLANLSPKQIRVSLYDQSAAENDRFLHSYSPREDGTTASPMSDDGLQKQLRHEGAITVADRTWMAVFTPTDDYVAAKKNWQPWAALVAGLLFTSSLAGYLYVSIGRARHIEELVEERTQANADLQTEINERKQAEELYRTLSEMSFAGIYVIQDGVFKFVNRTASGYSGYEGSSHRDDDDHEIIGKPMLSIVHPEDREHARICGREMLKGLRSIPYEYRIIAKTGEIRWIMETVASIHYEGKQAILGTAMDITEVKAAQKELEETKDLESSILSAIPHAVMGARNRDIIFANEGVENVFGWTREELINQSTRILFRSDEAYEDFGATLYTTLEQTKMVSGEYDVHFRHKDGRNLICRVTASRIGDTLTDQYITTTIEDVTNLRNIQMQLLQSEKMSSIGQLAAGVAHEINNPTSYVSSNLKTLGAYFDGLGSVINGYEALLGRVKEGLGGGASSELLSDQVDAIESAKKEIGMSDILDDVPNLIKESRQGTQRIRDIVMDLKNFAHPGKEAFEHADIIKNIESTLNVVWNELKYKATIQKDYGELPPVMCMPQQLNQVFMNLLVNAAQAIKDKGEIAIKTRHVDGHVEITIRDTGCGIPKANISRIFNPFFTTKEVGKGTGLGLNVAYNIVKKHNGTIDVESQMGQGTAFLIKIPVSQAGAGGEQ